MRDRRVKVVKHVEVNFCLSQRSLTQGSFFNSIEEQFENCLVERLYKAQIYVQSHQFFSICIIIALLLLRLNRELAPGRVSDPFAEELE